MNRRRNDHDIADEIVALLDSDEDKARHPDMEARSLIQQARDADGGGLRMQYLKQAQHAIAKLNPARHGRLISQLQSEVLALQGRRGDTKVAHVTPGEVVIPQRLQTREVLAALHAAARGAGIDPDRLVVGSGSNSINPETGQPEFAFSDPDMDYNTKRQPPPEEQQVADLYINYFHPSLNPLNPSPGHIGVGVNTNQTQGFYPKSGLGVAGPVPGVVKKDDLTRPHETLIIRTTEKEDKAAQEYIDERRNNPGNYYISDRQCTDFGAGAVRAAGKSVPSDSTPGIYDDWIPTNFFKQLKRQYEP